MSKKLNLGCGTDIRSGWINLDQADLDGVDVVHSITDFPLPFESDSLSEIVCQDVLEHVDYPLVLKELHRILEPGGTISIRVPHYSSFRNYSDPTHIRKFSLRTFGFFLKGSGREYYFDFLFSKITHKRLAFQRYYLLPLNPLVEFFVNLVPKLRDNLYEQSFLVSLFPAENIHVTMEK